MMRRIATFVVASIGLIMLALPAAHADPGLSGQDAIYTKWLTSIGVIYQDRVSTQTMIAEAHTTCAMLDQSPTPQTFDAAVNRLVGGSANFNKKDANGVVQAAIHSYCDGHSNLIHG
jgi:hypothetical protein